MITDWIDMLGSQEHLARLSKEYIAWVEKQEGKTEATFQVCSFVFLDLPCF